jgi:hypothetical protein
MRLGERRTEGLMSMGSVVGVVKRCGFRNGLKAGQERPSARFKHSRYVFTMAVF